MLELPSPGDPALRTLNPEPGTLNPQPGTLNPEPGTLNPEPHTRLQAELEVARHPVDQSVSQGRSQGQILASQGQILALA